MNGYSAAISPFDARSGLVTDPYESYWEGSILHTVL